MRSRARRYAVLPCFILVFFLLNVTAPAEDPAAHADTARPGQSSAQATLASSSTTVVIPGPLRSFLRMAAISQKVSPDEILPLLAYNIGVDGYHGQGRSRKPTEYLNLLKRYVDQARDLRALAGSDGVIRISACTE